MACDSQPQLQKGKPGFRRRDLKLLLRTPGSSGKKGHFSPLMGKSQTTVYSPVSDLALNLGELSTHGQGLDDTPKSLKRRPSRSGDLTPTSPGLRLHALDKQLSLDEGCFLDSPVGFESPSDSPFLHSRFGTSSAFSRPGTKSNGSPSAFKSSAFERFQSMPLPFCDLEDDSSQNSLLSRPCHDAPRERTPERHRPTFSLFDDDDNSQDSGVGLEKSDFLFRQPKRPAPRRLRVLSDETNSPHKYSPCKSSPGSSPSFASSRPVSAPVGSLIFSPDLLECSPVKLRHSSLTHDDAEDDGFLDLVDSEVRKLSVRTPTGMDQLMTAPVLSPCELDLTPGKHSIHSRVHSLREQENMRPKPNSSRRGLFRSPSTPRLNLDQSPAFELQSRAGCLRSKRDADTDLTPLNNKRRKSVIDCSTPQESARTPPSLHRCMSESEVMIKSALDRSEDNLIADFSKAYCLPLIPGKHSDLKALAPETVAQLVRGEHSHIVNSFTVVDCRYPYEYEGGHIKGAVNMYTKDAVASLLNEHNENRKTAPAGKRNILVFHCEFSSERGPKMSKFLRDQDRKMNKESYPSLHYPEVYLLEGGYKAFFESEKEMCEPQEYKLMLNENHREDLKLFRAKSKSWAGEQKSRFSRSRSLFA